MFSPDALRRAVAAEDLTALTRVPGIGRKGAQRIVLELPGGWARPAWRPGRPAASAAPGRARRAWRDQVRAGLVNLGWQPREADQAIAAIEPELASGGGRTDQLSGRRGGAAGGAARAGAAVTDPGVSERAPGGAGRAHADWRTSRPAVTRRSRLSWQRPPAERLVSADWPTPTSG